MAQAPPSKKMKTKIPKIKNSQSYLNTLNVFVTTLTRTGNVAAVYSVLNYFTLILYTALAVHFWCLYKAPLQKDMIHLEWRP